MTEETTKLALESLKTKLETEKLIAETELTRNKALNQALATLTPALLPGIKELLGSMTMFSSLTKGKEKRFEITKEDLTFFANRCTESDLQIIIEELNKVLNSKKK